ncbi:hypothetical protein AcV5_003726 [Taiwanofungus camphoratus]|nr:hypothetical protein AcV5_003726 [Antrodia cinnamomea]
MSMNNVKKRSLSPNVLLDSLLIPWKTDVDIKSAEPQNKKQHGLVNDGILVEDQVLETQDADAVPADVITEGRGYERGGNEGSAGEILVLQPKTDIKQERFLSDDTFFRRLAPADPDPYPVTADEKTQNFTVERMFICQRFGGGARDTFSEPKAEKLAKHGYNNLVCINLEYAPYAP